MWRELVGGWAYQAGTSGTVTLPEGASVLCIRAESHAANGSVQIFGGTAIPVDGSAAHEVFEREFNHTLCVAKSGALTIVFANTVSYYVEYVKAGP